MASWEARKCTWGHQGGAVAAMVMNKVTGMAWDDWCWVEADWGDGLLHGSARVDWGY